MQIHCIWGLFSVLEFYEIKLDACISSLTDIIKTMNISVEYIDTKPFNFELSQQSDTYIDNDRVGLRIIRG